MDKGRGALIKRAVFYLLLIGVYYLAGKLGLNLAIVNPSASAIWPPTGLALAALLWWGLEIWPVIFIGALLVNLTTEGTWLTAACIALGNTLEAVAGAFLVTRYAHGRYAFQHSNDVFKFVGLTAVGATAISATVGTTTLVLGGLAPLPLYGAIWQTWWQGNALSCLLITPLAMLWCTMPRLAWNRQQAFEAPLLLAAVILCGLAGFCGWYPVPMLTNFLRVSCIPLVIWAAFRLGPREAATTSALLFIIALWGTIHGAGPYGLESPNDALLRLQMFLGIITIMGISIGVEVSERKEAAQALAMANTYLETRVQERTTSLKEAISALQNQVSARTEADERFHRLLESNIIGFMIVDMKGKVQDANDAFLNALGYTREDLYAGLVGGPTMTPPEYHTLDEWAQVRLNEAGYCSPFEKEYIRKDGSRWPVLVGVVRLDKPAPHCVCFVIDVTQRRKAQQALQRAYDDMEKRVAGRTEELVAANVELEKEIVRRTHAEEQLRELSLRDPLTGLYNRRGFMILAEQHQLTAFRDKKEFLLFYADLDGLKQINDVLGHGLGDQAIVKAAEALRDTFRKSDIIARVGGDEFAVIAIDASPKERMPYFTRLDKRLERLNAAGDLPYVLSLSIGAAVFNLQEESSLKDLMTQSDEDLYKRKRLHHVPGFSVIRT